MIWADVERDMRLRVNKLQRFQEYSDISSCDSNNNEETEKIIKESEGFLDLRRRLKHRRDRKTKQD